MLGVTKCPSRSLCSPCDPHCGLALPWKGWGLEAWGRFQNPKGSLETVKRALEALLGLKTFRGAETFRATLKEELENSLRSQRLIASCWQGRPVLGDEEVPEPVVQGRCVGPCGCLDQSASWKCNCYSGM